MARGDKKRALAQEWGLDPNMSYDDIRKAVTRKKKLQAQKGTVQTIEVQESDIYADPDVVFTDLTDLVRMVSNNIQPSLLVTGMAGIGKTYTVTQVLERALGPEGQSWVHIKGKLSPLGMYRAFFVNRGKLIVFDDADSVFQNQDTINMLKAALDSYDRRTISWFSPMTVDVSRLGEEEINDLYNKIEEMLETDPANTKIKYPNRFDFTGQVIFISNLPASKVDSAVKSRSLTIDITLKRDDVVKHLHSILPNIGGDAPLEQKMEVLYHLKDHYKGELNIRSFILGIRCKQSGSDNWTRLIQYA
jgi:hypothetical protein